MTSSNQHTLTSVPVPSHDCVGKNKCAFIMNVSYSQRERERERERDEKVVRACFCRLTKRLFMMQAHVCLGGTSHSAHVVASFARCLAVLALCQKDNQTQLSVPLVANEYGMMNSSRDAGGGSLARAAATFNVSYLARAPWLCRFLTCTARVRTCNQYRSASR
jgi:hypothetical protein